MKVLEKNSLKFMKNKIVVLLCFTGCWFSSFSQKREILDQVVAIVGTQVITKSDIDLQSSNLNFPDDRSYFEGNCEFLKSAIFQRLLLNQAYIDSIEVKDEEIMNEINRRLDYFISQLGSKEALEKYYEKTVAEIREEMKEPIREMKMVQQIRNQITGDIIVSPTEVKQFYNSIPADSLPYYNTQVEVSQIVFYAKASAEEEEKAKTKVSEIRQRVLKGDKFSTMAILYSEDPGTATRGGDLGMRSRFDFVPEFSAAAMKLKKDSISEIIKTQYGYHIIKMIERKGDMIHVAHILIIPKITIDAKLTAQEKAKEVLSLIKKDSIGFESAAFKYSEDELTKNNGGRLLDVNTGLSKLEVDKIEASLFFVIDTMKVGQIVGPIPYFLPDGRQAYRLLFLKSKTPPHKANLNDDYPVLSDLAKEKKEQELLLKWINKKMETTYFFVNSPYDQCEGLQQYLKELKAN